MLLEVRDAAASPVFAHSRSCISQNLPWSPAQAAASPAFSAWSWKLEREVAEDPAHLVAVGLAHARDRRPGAHAERALEVRELDDRDRAPAGCRAPGASPSSTDTRYGSSSTFTSYFARSSRAKRRAALALALLAEARP